MARARKNDTVAKSSVEIPPAMRERFLAAANLAAELPEVLQPAAFARALDELDAFNATTSSNSRRAPAPAQPSRTGARLDDRVKILERALDRTKYPEISAELSVLDRSLLVLRAARDDHGVDGLTPSEIARLLTNKFRVSTSRAAASMALGAAGSLLDRQREGAGYIYRLMAPGDQYLARLGEAERSRPRSRAARKTTARSARRSKPTAKTGTSRPSPSTILKEQIEKGFFDQPKTALALVDYLRGRRGYKYDTSDFSMPLVRAVRTQMLERSRNSTGAYEYRSSSG